MLRKVMGSLFALSLLLLPTTIQGAGNDLGVHGGINTMNADVSASSEGDTGFLVGLTYDVILLGPLSIQPELNLNRVGAVNDNFGSMGTSRLTYIELPILAKATIFLGGVGVHAVAGPKISYLLDSSGPVSDADHRDYEVGLYLGAGLAFKVAQDSYLTLTGRYSFGLTDIDRSANNWKFNGFQLLAGLSI